MNRGERVADSFAQLVDFFYLPVEYPGQQRFLCYTSDEAYAERLVCALARELAKRVPSAQMGVHSLCNLDWTSREALVASLSKAMEEAAPALAARIPRRANGTTRFLAEQRLRLLMDPPDDVPEHVQTFVISVPGSALREGYEAVFSPTQGTYVLFGPQLDRCRAPGNHPIWGKVGRDITLSHPL